MTQYYESHITILETLPRKRIQQVVEKIGWKFSAIDGDPVLGKRVYCYGTKHRKLEAGDQVVKTELLFTADLCRSLGLNVVRSKVELVVFDDRAGDCSTCPRGVTP